MLSTKIPCGGAAPFLLATFRATGLALLLLVSGALAQEEPAGEDAPGAGPAPAATPAPAAAPEETPAPAPDALHAELLKRLEALQEKVAAAEGETSVDPASDEEATDALREKTIYVPYDRLNDVFEKEGRGIFLPYKEFIELWKKALPPEKQPEKEPPPPAEAVLSGGVYRGEVVDELARLEVTYEVEALKKKGWSVLPLGMKGVSVESVRIVPATAGDAGEAKAGETDPESASKGDELRALFTGSGGEYAVYFPRPGSYRIEMTIAVRVSSRPGQRSLSFQIPPAAISRLELLVPEENPRLEVQPASAATSVQLVEGKTRVVAYLGNSTSVGVSWSPPAGKIQEEEALLRASQIVNVHLNERVLRLKSGVILEILSQQVNRVRMAVPANLQVISVRGENLREWDRDPESGVLELQLHSGVEKSYSFQVSYERILDSTPESLVVDFPRVEGVLREDGHVALGYDDSLRVRVTASQGLSQRDLDELPGALRQSAQAGFRYLAHPVQLTLGIEKILPVVHARTTTVVALGAEEDQWIGWVDYRITRSGIFGLRLQVPSVWRPISIGDEATVEDFQAAPLADDATRQIITVNLKQRAIGNFRLPFRFSREGRAAEGEQTIVAPVVLDVESDRGLLGVGAPRSFQLTTARQERTVSADVQELFQSGILGQLPQESDATLAFTYNDQPASVAVRLAARKTEIKVTTRLLTNVKDAIIEFSQDMEYLVQYAAVDALSFSAPEALDERLRVEVRGFKEIQKVGTRDGRSIWRVSLQSAVLGIVTLKVSLDQELEGLVVGAPFQVAVPRVQSESIEGAEVRSETGAIAIRKEGGLEIQTPEAQLSGLELIDSRELPSELAQGRIYKAFRFNSPDYTLGLELIYRQYEKLAEASVPLLKVRARLSRESLLTCAAVFLVDNAGRQSLDIRLPAGSRLLDTQVNGRRVQSSRPPGPAGGTAESPGVDLSVPLTGLETTRSTVRVDYRVSLGDPLNALGDFEIRLPRLIGSEPEVPVGKAELELLVPRDYEYVGRSGNLYPRTELTHDPWEGVRRQLWALVGVRQEVHARSGAPASGADEASSQVFRALGEIGENEHFIQLDYQGYSPEGRLALSYLSQTAFRFLAGFLFFVSLAACIVVVRRRPADRLRWIAVIALVALLVSWLLADARAAFSLSIFLSSTLIIAFLAVRRIGIRGRQIVETWRAERLSLAPDPFLEEATPAAPAKESPATEAPADSTEKKDDDGSDEKAPEATSEENATSAESEDSGPSGKKKKKTRKSRKSPESPDAGEESS